MIAWLALAAALLALGSVVCLVAGALVIYAKVRPAVEPLLAMFSPPKPPTP